MVALSDPSESSRWIRISHALTPTEWRRAAKIVAVEVGLAIAILRGKGVRLPWTFHTPNCSLIFLVQPSAQRQSTDAPVVKISIQPTLSNLVKASFVSRGIALDRAKLALSSALPTLSPHARFSLRGKKTLL